jgi:hypothetical protein
MAGNKYNHLKLSKYLINLISYGEYVEIYLPKDR